MADLLLLVSNPPYPDIDPDRLASLFGVSRAEAAMKVRNPGPEVWLADTDRGVVDQQRAAFTDAGLATRIVTPAALGDLSERSTLRRFAFEHEGDRGCTLHLELLTGERQRYVSDHPGVAVLCRPTQLDDVQYLSFRQAAAAANRNPSLRQQARASLSAIPDAQLDRSFIDLYVPEGGRTLRYTIPNGVTSFDGLGPAMARTGRKNQDLFLDALADRFPEIRIDRRLDPAPVPRITLLGDRTLRAHLGAVRADLGEIDEYDLLSRLAFLSAGGFLD